MGRHGKNLARSVPLAKPMPDIGKWAHQWEKDLISDQERRIEFGKGYEQGIYSAFAAFCNILLFHYKELANLKHRLPLAEIYFDKILEQMDRSSEEQRFAEWYYTETTGFEFCRKEAETMANREAKITIGEIVDKKIADKGLTRAETAKKIDCDGRVLAQLRMGKVTKKVIDDVMTALGETFTPAEMNIYKEAYGVGNNDTARFKEIETRIIERETDALTAAVPIKTEAIPVPEELPELVEAVVANENKVEDNAEELPFADCNEMYKEAVVPPAVAKPSEMLRQQLDYWRVEQQQIRKEEEEHLRIAELLKQKADKLGLKFAKLQDTLRSVEELGL